MSSIFLGQGKTSSDEIAKKNRLAYAKAHSKWTSKNWNTVIFSDESRFEVCVGDSRKRVLRKASEAFKSDCLKRTVKFKKSVMVWGCMSGQGVGHLALIDGIVNSMKYQQILENYLLPSIDALKGENGVFIFQQDGASCHTSKSTKNWLATKSIAPISWPSSSPDLSPIETLWHIMKKKLRTNPASTVEELKLKLCEIWQSFTPDLCANLVGTMSDRINSVINRKGDVTQW